MKGKIEIVEAYLESDEGWYKVLEGCKYVLHLASPVASFSKIKNNSDKEKELI